MADRKRIGLVILSDPTPHEWTDEEILPFQATAAQLASVLASRRDHDALVSSSQKLAVMEVRRKIARDLHDHVIQQLFASGLTLQGISMGMTDRVRAERIEGVVEHLDVAIQQIRNSIFELRDHVGPQGPGVRAAVLDVVTSLGEDRWVGLVIRVGELPHE